MPLRTVSATRVRSDTWSDRIDRPRAGDQRNAALTYLRDGRVLAEWHDAFQLAERVHNEGWDARLDKPVTVPLNIV